MKKVKVEFAGEVVEIPQADLEWFLRQGAKEVKEKQTIKTK